MYAKMKEIHMRNSRYLEESTKKAKHSRLWPLAAHQLNILFNLVSFTSNSCFCWLRQICIFSIGRKRNRFPYISRLETRNTMHNVIVGGQIKRVSVDRSGPGRLIWFCEFSAISCLPFVWVLFSNIRWSPPYATCANLDKNQARKHTHTLTPTFSMHFIQ